jgi:hypothetical protein
VIREVKTPPSVCTGSSKKTSFTWIAGHRVNLPPSIHERHQEVHTLAKTHVYNPIPSSPHPILPPNYEVEAILLGNTLATSHLSRMITTKMYREDQKNKIMKDTRCNIKQFNMIDWDAHKAALLDNNRFHQISNCKLIFALVHTNQQSEKYYGIPGHCPCCHHDLETFDILSCPSTTAKSHRKDARSTLEQTLTKINTPSILSSAILFGLDSFINNQGVIAHNGKHAFYGSVQPTAMIAANCIMSQFLQGARSYKVELAKNGVNYKLTSVPQHLIY